MLYSYKHIFNGFSAHLSSEEFSALSGSPFFLDRNNNAHALASFSESLPFLSLPQFLLQMRVSEYLVSGNSVLP